MADSVLNILVRIKSEAQDSLNSLNKVVQSINEQMDGLAAVNKEVADTAPAAAAGTEQVTESLLKLTDTVPNLITGLKAVAASFVGLKVFDYLKEAVETAARTEVLGTVLHAVAENAGITAEEIDKVDKSVQRMGITAQASRQSLVQFLQAGLDVNQAAKLARSAQDLAVVAGQNSSDTFARMITNIQQLDTLGLRWMGIVLNASEAYDTYAKTVGKSAQGLSQAEKQQAFMNGVLVEAAKLTGTYENAMGNAAKKVQSLARIQETLADTIGDSLKPAYGVLVDQYTIFLENATAAAAVFSANEEGALSLADAVKELAETVRHAAEFLLQHSSAILTIIKYYLLWKASVLGIGVLTSAMARLTAITATVATATAGAGASIKSLGDKAVATTTKINAMWLAAVAGPAAIVITVSLIVKDFVRSTDIGRKIDDYVTHIKDEFWAAVKGAFTIAVNWGEPEAKETMSKLATMQEKAKELFKNIFSGDPLAGVAEDQVASITETLQEYFVLQEQINALSDKEAKARAAGLIQLANEAAEEKKNLKTRAQSLYDQATAQAEANSVGEEGLDILKKNAKEVTEAKAEQRAYESQLKATNESLKTLGVGVRTSLGDNVFFVSEKLSQMQGAAVTAFAAYRDGATDATGKAVVDIKQVEQAMETFAGLAKTPEEVAYAIQFIGENADVAADTAERLVKELQMKGVKEDITSIADKVKALTEAQKQLQASAEVNASVQAELAKAQDQLVNALLATGSTADEAASGVSRLNGEFDALQSRGAIKLQASIDVAALERGISHAKTLYASDLANYELTVSARLDALSKSVQTSESMAKAEATIEREAATERVSIAKKYFDTLVGLRNEAFGKQKEYNDKVISLDKELIALRAARDNDVKNIQQSQLTEVELLAAKKVEAERLASEASIALMQGDYEKAKEYGNKRIALEKEIADANAESGVIDTAKLEESYAVVEQVLTRQKEEAKAAAEAQKQVYDNLTNTLGTLATTIDKLTAQEAIKIKVEVPDAVVGVSVDQSSLNSAVDEIKNKLEGISATIKVVAAATGGFISRAAGGPVWGAGTETSDSIWARLSNGEFVIRAAAVRNYGINFFHSLNNMMTPKNNVPAFAMGGPVMVDSQQGTRDLVDLDLGVSGKKFRVQGERHQVASLAKAITTVKRGSL